jgi:hypothetical protein
MMMFTAQWGEVAPGRGERQLCPPPARNAAARYDAGLSIHPHSGEPMSITMHSASVPIFVRMLGNMKNWLDKAQAHAEAKKFDTGVYLAARFAPDMLPFNRQIQIACDGAKFGVARLAGLEAPSFPDTEVTLTELRERIDKTLTFIQSVPAAQLDGTEDKDVVVPRRSGPITLKGEFYLKHFELPNFFFHVTTTYALLRHNGVELGKADYLGALE